MHVDRRETETSRWEIARRAPPTALRPYLLGTPQGWEQMRGVGTQLREVPVPGVPLIVSFGSAWELEDPGGVTETHSSFMAGMHTAPALVRGGATWGCIDLRLTPLAAHRLLGLPMHELTNRTIELDDVIPEARELNERLHEAGSWGERFDLVERFLARRLVEAAPPSPAVAWSWEHLRRTNGQASISHLAEELGWSHRRLIARFREQIGVTPKVLARVIRFDRAASALRSSTARGLAEIAFDCGYFDQAHLNREFREFAGTTPASFRAAHLGSGAVAA